MDLDYFCFLFSGSIQINILSYYPSESFRGGLWNHRRWFVCLFVTTITK